MTIFASALLLSAHLNAFHLSETIKKVDFWGGVAYIYIIKYVLFQKESLALQPLPNRCQVRDLLVNRLVTASAEGGAIAELEVPLGDGEEYWAWFCLRCFSLI